MFYIRQKLDARLKMPRVGGGVEDTIYLVEILIKHRFKLHFIYFYHDIYIYIHKSKAEGEASGEKRMKRKKRKKKKIAISLPN